MQPATKLSSALHHLLPSDRKWRKTEASDLTNLVFNLEVILKTFLFHMENSKRRMSLKIQAAHHFSMNKVSFFVLGDVLRP